MAGTRTTIVLDDESRSAARALAKKLDVTPSEVIRRALVEYRDTVLGTPVEARRRRVAALQQLFRLFEGLDAETEIAERKAEDRHW